MLSKMVLPTIKLRCATQNLRPVTGNKKYNHKLIGYFTEIESNDSSLLLPQK